MKRLRDISLALLAVIAVLIGIWWLTYPTPVQKSLSLNTFGMKNPTIVTGSSAEFDWRGKQEQTDPAFKTIKQLHTLGEPDDPDVINRLSERDFITYANTGQVYEYFRNLPDDGGGCIAINTYFADCFKKSNGKWYSMTYWMNNKPRSFSRPDPDGVTIISTREGVIGYQINYMRR